MKQFAVCLTAMCHMGSIMCKGNMLRQIIPGVNGQQLERVN